MSPKSVLVRAEDENVHRGEAGRRYFPIDAARVCWAAGIVVFLGVLLDLTALIVQRNAIPQFEFVAATRGLESLPTLLLALILFYIAMHIGQNESVALRRVLALGLIVLGLAGAALGFLVITDYFALARTVSPEAKVAFRATVAKAVGLAALDVALLVPVGILGFRNAKR